MRQGPPDLTRLSTAKEHTHQVWYRDNLRVAALTDVIIDKDSTRTHARTHARTRAHTHARTASGGATGTGRGAVDGTCVEPD